LCRIFPDHVISQFGNLTWLPRFPDLSAPSYYLWGDLKSCVCQTWPTIWVNSRSELGRSFRQYHMRYYSGWWIISLGTFAEEGGYFVAFHFQNSMCTTSITSFVFHGNTSVYFPQSTKQNLSMNKNSLVSTITIITIITISCPFWGGKLPNICLCLTVWWCSKFVSLKSSLYNLVIHYSLESMVTVVESLPSQCPLCHVCCRSFFMWIFVLMPAFQPWLGSSSGTVWTWTDHTRYSRRNGTWRSETSWS
jgi:hypothetical protein